MSTYQMLVGDNLQTLKSLPAESVHCIVTSPPYFGLRDYGLPPTAWPSMKFAPMPGLRRMTLPAMECCLGLEPDPWAYVAHLVLILREARRVLRKDGVLWLNLGDSYAGSWGAQSRGNTAGEAKSRLQGSSMLEARRIEAYPLGATGTGSVKRYRGLKPKDLIGIPWRAFFALQADGWFGRQDVIWSKDNPMPEPVKDRCTKSHEYFFILTRSQRYYFDHEAIDEPAACPRGPGNKRGYEIPGQREGNNRNLGSSVHKIGKRETRNKRSVWQVPTAPYKDAHFATFPPALIVPCILAGSPRGGVVLDLFGGSGTVAGVANALGRDAVLCELSPDYPALVPKRVARIKRDFEHLNQIPLPGVINN